VITYRKSDLWKVFILVVLIAGTFWFSFRTIMKAGGPRPAPARATQVGAVQPGGPSDVVAGASEMFASRERPTTQLLIRAHSAQDPFKPYLSFSPPQLAPAANRPASAAAPKAAPVRITAADELATQLRLVGIISGVRPTAVLVGADGHHYVQVGDSLPGGWRVGQIDQRGVALTKGANHARLALKKEVSRTK
jgi:hypothetical protein